MIKRDGLFSTAGMTQSDRCLHTPGAFAKQNLLYVQEVGRLESLRPHRCIREKLESYLFMVVLEGKGSLEINGIHYEVAQGDCALIDCMEHYEHISDEQDAWKLAWVHFNGHAAKGYYELFLKYNGNKNIFHSGNVKQWDALVGELLENLKEKNFEAELKCGELMLELLNRIIISVSGTLAAEDEQEKQLLGDLRELLNKHYAEADVSQYAENALGKKLSELNSKFTKQYGIGIEEYIDNRQLNAAKELLRFSIKPVEEIASESGIGDVDKMQQMFRDEENMTADEYRAKWAAWIR